MTEPYFWTPSNSDEVIAFEAMLSDVAGSESGQLIIRDFVPTAAVDHAVDAGAVAWSFALPEPTVTHTPAATVAHAVNAGDASFAFAVPQPTVTHTAAPTVQLVLSDSDDTGLEVVAKALLAASAAATVAGNIFWADADRGRDRYPA